jgi:hypothetical protein
MTGSNLRSVHPYVDQQQHSSSVPGSVSNSLTGGKKRKSYRRRSKKAGSSCGLKGGMGFTHIIREALVPFGLYTLQKRTQRRRNKKYMGKSRKFKNSRKSSKSRKSRR